ncbi:MAG: hypothetical protein H7836_04345 [Magnetococcus sp. YQC-3]
MTTLADWWKNQRPLPPFKIKFKNCQHEVEIVGVKIYPHNIWFLDGFNNEYFDGSNKLLELERVPYIVEKRHFKDYGLEY